MFTWPISNEQMLKHFENPMMGVYYPRNETRDIVRLTNLAGQTCEFRRYGDTWNPVSEKDWTTPSPPPPPPISSRGDHL